VGFSVPENSGRYAIYYFSATGNSLAAAQCLADELHAAKPISIPGSLVLPDPYEAAREADKVGFVFPVHRASVPEMVKGFISSMPVSRSTYYFAVSTYTLFGCNEFLDIDDILSAKGAMLNYSAGVRMMGNVGPDPSQRTVSKRLEQMQLRTSELAEAIANGQEDYCHPSLRLIGQLVAAFTEARRKRIVFHVGAQCTRCGVCALVCPAQNIQFSGGDGAKPAPVRSDRCEACLACIHWCPAKAISTRAPLHSSYHNPRVSPEQLNQAPS